MIHIGMQAWDWYIQYILYSLEYGYIIIHIVVHAPYRCDFKIHIYSN